MLNIIAVSGLLRVRLPAALAHGGKFKMLYDCRQDCEQYAGWRFNNVQPVVGLDGSIVDGMLLFYGWMDRDIPEAKAFLLHEDVGFAPVESVSTRN